MRDKIKKVLQASNTICQWIAKDSMHSIFSNIFGMQLDEHSYCVRGRHLGETVFKTYFDVKNPRTTMDELILIKNAYSI